MPVVWVRSSRPGTGGKGDLASTIDLSSADRKKLLAKTKKKPLGSITDVVASEKTKHLLLKLVGGAFGTIIAPLLVFYLIRHLEKEDKPNPPVANAPAAPVGTVPTVAVATNATTQPPHIENDGSPKPMVAPFDAARAKAGQAAWAKHLGTTVETINSVGMRMTLIPPGEFMMGSSEEQVAAIMKANNDFRHDDERAQHPVAITRPFLIGTTEVTIGQFRKFVESTAYLTDADKYGFGDSDQTTLDKARPSDKGRNWKSPGYPTTDDVPVSQITWNEAVASRG